MQTRPTLTARQAEIVDFISQRLAANGYPPTIREIGAHLGIRSTNGVADHLKALKRKGYLRQTAAKSRAWQLLGDGGEAAAEPQHQVQPPVGSTMVQVPMCGRVAAGEPILAVEEAEETIGIDPNMVPTRGTVFALKVTGRSMIEAGILPDDVIFVRQQATAESGAIVVAMIDDAATVKRYVPAGQTVRFEPANAAMKPLVLTARQAKNARIIGVVVGLSRRL